MAPRRVLVTGAAGFIGAALSHHLLDGGDSVVGLDDLNDYYDVSLKEARLARLTRRDGFRFVKVNLADSLAMKELFAAEKFDTVVNLAAQAGVRYSLTNPMAYVEANLVGFTNILEGCRHSEVGHLVYASSSSVYGSNRVYPFSENQSVDHPVSLYAASKKANELMAHTYSHLYNLPTTGLRFFTVYGPWGRPDMALFLFTKAILEGRPIDVFNNGDMRRDFTYIDDIVSGVVAVMSRAPEPNAGYNHENPEPRTSSAPYRLYNIGGDRSESLMRMIEVLEKTLGQKVEKNMLPMQPGDVKETTADISAINRDFGFRPTTAIDVGIPNFVTWYREFYGV